MIKKQRKKRQNFTKSTSASPPTGNSGETNLPPIGSSFMYIETSSGNSGSDNVFYSFERNDIVQTSNITFNYNRRLTGSKKTMRRFIIQFLLSVNTWITRSNIPKKDRQSNSSTHLTSHSENYGNKLICHEIDRALADVCFSNITITQFV